ncbi:MAG: hypothetical protein GXO61_04885 [Epsilonproteobacteria bacterium]|nr:hypothetical protein [Campylobacterota bacterium]
MKINVDVMFFDAKMDYLPYYKSYSVEVDPKERITELFKKIKEQNPAFDFPSSYPLARINSQIVNPNRRIYEVVEKIGDNWRVEPASKYRSLNDLIIDEDDFKNAYKLLEPFMESEERAMFWSLKDIHYASDTFEFDKEYIGDAALLIAYKLFKKGKEEVLDLVAPYIWVEYENNLLLGKDLSEIFKTLQEVAPKPQIGFWDKLKDSFCRKKGVPKIERLEDVPISIYAGRNDDTPLRNFLEKEKANIVEISRSKKLAGQTIVEYNPSLAYKRAAVTLLEAMDNGAELVACVKKDDAIYFRENFGKFEREIGREIMVEIVTFEELQRLNLKKNQKESERAHNES